MGTLRVLGGLGWDGPGWVAGVNGAASTLRVLLEGEHLADPPRRERRALCDAPRLGRRAPCGCSSAGKASTLRCSSAGKASTLRCFSAGRSGLGLGWDFGAARALRVLGGLISWWRGLQGSAVPAGMGGEHLHVLGGLG